MAESNTASLPEGISSLLDTSVICDMDERALR